MAGDTGSLGGELLSSLQNRGVWVKVATSTTVEITLGGASATIDPQQLQSGWNLVGFGPELTAIEQMLIHTAANRLQILRLFAFVEGGWQFRDILSEQGSLEQLDPDYGVWVYTQQPLIITQNGVEADTIDLGEGLTATLFATTAGGEMTDLSFDLGSGETARTVTVSAPSAVSYTLRIGDANDNFYPDIAVTTAANDLTALEPFTTGLQLYVYGMPAEAGSPTLLQDVAVYSGDNYLDTLIDPVTGLTLDELAEGTTLTLQKEGYLDVALTVESGQSVLYAIMQQASSTHGQLIENQYNSDDYVASRPLDASAPLTVPSNGDHQLGAVLLHRAGRNNPNQSINIRVTPYQGLDAINDVETLSQQVASDFIEAYSPTGASNPDELNSNPFWSWQIIAGAQMEVTDMTTGEVITDRSSSTLGAYATIDPYQATLISGKAEEYQALLQEFGQSSDYPAVVDLYVRGAQGWQLASTGVRFIDPTLDEATEGVDIYDAQESYAVAGQLPLNRLIIAPATTGTLMTQDSGGGLFDYVFVLKQLTPVTRDMTVTVTDTAGAPLANALVSLNWGLRELSDSRGQVVFSDIAMPLTEASLNLEALRNDHYRNGMALSVGDLLNNTEPAYTLQLRPVNETATIRGTITDVVTGEPLEKATVRLITPAALSQLSYDEGTFTAYNDPQANYRWQIRARDVLASSGGRLLRLLDSDWVEIKADSGANEGYQLTESEVVQALLVAEEGQDSSALFYMVGDYDLTLTVEYDIDQDGTADFSETSGDGMGVSVSLNPAYITANGRGESDSDYSLDGSIAQGFFVLRRLGSTVAQPSVLWQLDTPHETIELNQQPTPILNWRYLLDQLSTPQRVFDLIADGSIENSQLTLRAMVTVDGVSRSYSQHVDLAIPYSDEPLETLALHHGTAVPGGGERSGR
ncbi:hypothetical protein D5085_12190 [Ectothiorhodospiraceae bacterium BW-2]|nr:hypothetical protein D5085_12190 [Ectothiorhodospiraceae bacterium BW-2]